MLSIRHASPLSQLFLDAFARPAAHTEASWMPRADIQKQADHFIIRLDLAGVDPAQVDISVEGRALVVKGQRSAAQNDAQWLRRELVDGDFERRFNLGEQINVDGIEASGQFGVLTIKLPIRATELSKKISVQTH
jgi:HSP20 family protein